MKESAGWYIAVAGRSVDRSGLSVVNPTADNNYPKKAERKHFSEVFVSITIFSHVLYDSASLI